MYSNNKQVRMHTQGSVYSIDLQLCTHTGMSVFCTIIGPRKTDPWYSVCLIMGPSYVCVKTIVKIKCHGCFEYYHCLYTILVYLCVIDCVCNIAWQTQGSSKGIVWIP